MYGKVEKWHSNPKIKPPWCHLKRRERIMCGNHIPLFQSKDHKKNNNLVKAHTEEQEISPVRKRQIRSDKCKDIKFPISKNEQIRMKIACKKTAILYKKIHGPDEKLTQTHFNTLLLRYGLKQTNEIDWNRPYIDTKIYMHAKPTEKEYESTLGGTQGIGTLKALSDRKLLYLIVIAALEILERKEDYHNVLL